MNHPPAPASKLWVQHPSIVSLTLYVYGYKQLFARPSQLTSQVHCLAKFPTVTLTNPPCISLTPSQAQWKIRKRTIFALGGGDDDDDGNEFLLTACEVSGPTLNALLASPHLILTKTLLHMQNRWGNWHIKRLNDSPKISQLEGNRTQDVNLGLSDTTLSF